MLTRAMNESMHDLLRIIRTLQVTSCECEGILVSTSHKNLKLKFTHTAVKWIRLKSIMEVF